MGRSVPRGRGDGPIRIYRDNCRSHWSKAPMDGSSVPIIRNRAHVDTMHVGGLMRFKAILRAPRCEGVTNHRCGVTNRGWSLGRTNEALRVTRALVGRTGAERIADVALEMY